MHQFRKHFTLQEARALLPELRRLFESIHENKAAVEQADVTLEKELSGTGGDVGGNDLVQLLKATAALHDRIKEIETMGIQIKDMDRGLVDFPFIRDGHEVFLCWELDEDDIEFWHDIDSGYGGRERL